jgi:large subunit ribosomal protein L3
MILPLVLGKKGEMSRLFTEGGINVPVTFISTEGFCVTDIVQKPDSNVTMVVGLGKAKRMPKPERGKLLKNGITDAIANLKFVNYPNATNIVKGEENSFSLAEKDYVLGASIENEVLFTVGDVVNVRAVSKGKGFAGVVKRHGFAGGPKTHGQSDRERAPGSIGQRMTPGRVFKNLKMAGRMGGEYVTVKNLSVVKVESNGIYVKGLIPGHRTSLIEIYKA